MHTIFKSVIVVLLGAVLATTALAQAKPKGTRLTGAELEKLYRTPRGTMIEAENVFYGSRTSAVYMLNGLTLTQWVDPQRGAGQDTGTWRISGDTMCVKDQVVYSGDETCFRVFKVGDNAYESWFAERDQQNSSFRVRP